MIPFLDLMGKMQYHDHMNTVTIPKKEYEKMRHYSDAYVTIVEEITKAETDFPYDYNYIDRLTREAVSAHRGGKTIEAESVDEALKKFRRQARKK